MGALSYPDQASNSQYVDMEDPSELIDQSDYSLDGNQSGEAMVYEGDPENSGDILSGHGSGRFQCGICFKRFRDNYKLKRHGVVHTKEKPFPCHLCGGRFTQFDSLKGHMKAKHQDLSLENST